jgi:hypothetical protein
MREVSMTQAEMELELGGLRQELAQFRADDEARRKKGKLFAFADLFCAFALLSFGFVLYLNNDPLNLPLLLIALVLIFLGSSVMALASPRPVRAPSR